MIRVQRNSFFQQPSYSLPTTEERPQSNDNAEQRAIVYSLQGRSEDLRVGETSQQSQAVSVVNGMDPTIRVELEIYVCFVRRALFIRRGAAGRSDRKGDKS